MNAPHTVGPIALRHTGSKRGATTEIAKRIGERLVTAGLDVEVRLHPSGPLTVASGDWNAIEQWADSIAAVLAP